jgi:hypothetical protein
MHPLVTVRWHGLQAVRQVRAGGHASSDLFDIDAVGPSGAGFDHFLQQGTVISPVDILTSIALPSAALAAQRIELLAPSAVTGDVDPDGDKEAEEELEVEGAGDPEAVFKREVQETLLRTIVLAQDSDNAKSSMTENAVIELNGLKIAGAPCPFVACCALRDLLHVFPLLL